MKYSKLVILFALFFSLSLSFDVFAKSENANPGQGKKPDKEELMERKEQKKEEIEQKKEEKKEQIELKKQERNTLRCERVRERVQNKIRNYGELKQNQAGKYQAFVNRIQDAATKLETKGFDVSSLQTDINNLQSLVDEYLAAYQDFLTVLDTLEVVCDGEDYDYKAILRDVRGMLADARTARKAIVQYYAHDVRKSIWEIRQQAKIDDVEESTESTESQNE